MRAIALLLALSVPVFAADDAPLAVKVDGGVFIPDDGATLLGKSIAGQDAAVKVCTDNLQDAPTWLVITTAVVGGLVIGFVGGWAVQKYVLK